jgi:hypothetical protein
MAELGEPIRVIEVIPVTLPEPLQPHPPIRVAPKRPVPAKVPA